MFVYLACADVRLRAHDTRLARRHLLLLCACALHVHVCATACAPLVSRCQSLLWPRFLLTNLSPRSPHTPTRGDTDQSTHVQTHTHAIHTGAKNLRNDSPMSAVLNSNVCASLIGR
jgi:hypothetical protein